MSLPISYNDINKKINFAVEKEKQTEEKEEKIKLKDVLFDFEKERFIYDGLEPRHITNKVDILKQWIKKLFYTERDRWNVYINELGYPFGLNLHKYVGQQLFPNMDLLEVIKDDIYNSLMINKDIKEIHCLQLVQDDEKLNCAFIIELVDGGGFETEEVVA